MLNAFHRVVGGAGPSVDASSSPRDARARDPFQPSGWSDCWSARSCPVRPCGSIRSSSVLRGGASARCFLPRGRVYSVALGGIVSHFARPRDEPRKRERAGKRRENRTNKASKKNKQKYSEMDSFISVNLARDHSGSDGDG